MRISSLTRLAVMPLCVFIAGTAYGQVQHIFLDTTGDFGLDDNWSDPTKAPPEMAGGTDVFNHYYINGSRTATISAGSPNGSHFQVFHIFPGDSPPGQPPTPGTLIFEGGPEPAPGELARRLRFSA